MRELKFRVWNPKYKSFLYWGFIDKVFVGIPSCSGLNMDDCKNKSEQYTGLIDCEGKEIWEGDVVQCGDSIAMVEWDAEIDQDFYLGNACGFVFNFSPDKMNKERSLKVIGHIHNESLMEAIYR